MENKKVKNAKVVEYEGVTFKSKLELGFYRILTQAGFNPQYENKTYTLIPGKRVKVPFYTKDTKTRLLKLDSTKLRPITYTPDFTFMYNDLLVIIEAKGRQNDVYPIKRKLFRHLLENFNTKVLFIEAYTQKQLLEAIKIIKHYGLNQQDGENATSPPI
jgi:hypothetical protein